MTPIQTAVIALVVFTVVSFIWHYNHEKTISLIAERLDKLVKILQPVIDKHARASFEDVLIQLDNLADSLEKDVADNPEAQKIMGPSIKSLRGLKKEEK